ncbi:hypothetical protein EDB80DRAFT_329712 [Ilyonectria destructans]|nr:hypothetical protein EDB80DRAFT_329712 [Ilyonectria destructans]
MPPSPTRSGRPACPSPHSHPHPHRTPQVTSTSRIASHRHASLRRAGSLPSRRPDTPLAVPGPSALPQAASLVAQHDGCDQSMSSAADHALTATRRPLTRLFPATPALLSLCSAMTRPACPTTHHFYLNLTPPPPRPTSQSSTDSPAIISLHTRCLSLSPTHPRLSRTPLLVPLRSSPWPWTPPPLWPGAHGAATTRRMASSTWLAAGSVACGLHLGAGVLLWAPVLKYPVRLLLVLALVLGLMDAGAASSVFACFCCPFLVTVVAGGCCWLLVDG